MSDRMPTRTKEQRDAQMPKATGHTKPHPKGLMDPISTGKHGAKYFEKRGK